MNEHDQHDTLDLEEIMREFGSGTVPPPEPEEPAPQPAPEADSPPLPEEPQEPEQPAPEEPAFELPSLEALAFGGQQIIEETPAAALPEEAAAEEPDAPAQPQVTSDTIRLDCLRDIPAQTEAPPEAEPEGGEGADTIRLDPGQVAQALEEGPAPGAREEPEYEDDDEDEITLPPRIILFRPRTRLKELKKDLVSGPEKRYYELSEQGVGKLQMAMFLCLVVVLLSGGAALLYNQGLVPASRMKLMVFGQILAMLIGALLGSQQLIDGVSDLFRGRFTPNTLLFFTLSACAADGVFCLKEERVPLCAAFTLEVAMALWCAYHKRTTETGMMDSLRKANRLSALVRREEYFDGRPAFLRTDGKVADFMENYQQTPGPEKKQNFCAFFALLLSIGAAVVAGLSHGLSMALLVLSTTLLVSFPASFFVAISRPQAVLERKLHSLGTVLCGWQGIKGLAGRAVFPLEDEDLFPTGAAKLNGVKFYEHHDPDQVIAYAAALMRANGGCLAPTFDQLLTSRNGVRYTAANVHFYGNGGIGGMVNGEPVLMGDLDFLKDMGVEIPEGTQVRQAVYVSVDGDLAGLFAINYARMKYAVNGLATLASYSKLKTLILASDFMITAPFLKEKFKVSDRRMIFPDRETKEALAAQTAPEDGVALALTTADGLAPAAYAVTGARVLRKAWTLGLIVHIIGGLLGTVIMVALAVLGSAQLLTPVHILLYQLVWMIPGLLVTFLPRAI